MGTSAEEAVAERRSGGLPSAIAAGLIIGALEVVLAVAFAAFVFGGVLVTHLSDGIGLYLAAAALTLAVLAWRAGRRGVVGSVQDAAVAVLAVVAATTAAKSAAIARIVESAAVAPTERPDVFLTVIAATLVVTIACGVVFSVLGTFRLGNLIRFVPYPVVGGFLAGTGWLLLKGGIYVSSGVVPYLRTVGDLLDEYALVRWGPAFLFGVVLLLATRFVKRPLVIPVVIGLGVLLFVAGMLLTGSSLDEARDGGWLLGPFESTRLWEPWTLRALTGADWSEVLAQLAGIATAVFVAVLAILFNVSGTELVLRRDLDTNRELRDAGLLNVVSGAVGGPPAYHALSLTALADRMRANARVAGLIAAFVPLAAVVLGADVVELVPRLLLGGVLVFLGLAFIVEWVWDKRRALPTFEYVVVLVILGGIIARGFLPGVVLGLVLALVLFAVNYGRIELIREVEFGDAYHSNVDRPPAERETLRAMGDRVQILRLHGFVFFGTADGLLERIRRRVEAGGLEFLLMDVRRVSGLDSSAAGAFVKVTHVAEANGFELVLMGASESVRAQLERGGVTAAEDVVRFEPDLDRGLQRCEEALLAAATPGKSSSDGDVGMPPGLARYAERRELPVGAVLIRQGESPDGLFVLESGRLGVETVTPDGARMRLRAVRPGAVVGEVAMYTGAARTADVVAETPSVVLWLSRAAIDRLEVEDPALAATMHRWLARAVAVRLDSTMKAFDALLV
jgi:SulP family sulfate permease